MADPSGKDELKNLRERLAAQEATVDTLIEMLVGKEVLGKGHKKILEKAANKPQRSLPQIRLGPMDDKYNVEGADIDCAARLHLCGARCCRLEASLGQQDLDERELEWETQRPYVIKRAEDGYCTYLGDNGGCTCYEKRPTVCRVFDCRNDKRIWQDFDKMIPTEDVFIRIYEPPSE